ncbi:MAG: glutamate 5-kinase, partial [Candidatus Hydrogenedentes bacterium]|nr:glutamate 5-kinase [Candidatus Hydrogenedentota bacterium]
KNPAQHRDARLIERVEAVTDEITALAEGTSTATSTGGMRTKLDAAKIACASGLPMVIASGRRAHVIQGIIEGTCPCTWFGASKDVMPHRKRWIAFGRQTQGVLIVDDGARKALVEKGKSLLPAGIVAVEGTFDAGAAVKVKDMNGVEIARGLTNYSSGDIERIKGSKSNVVQSILGRKDFDEVIHRDNLAALAPKRKP